MKLYDPVVWVCSRCHEASCWQGEFMCDFAYEANIVKRKISTLVRNAEVYNGRLLHEHPDYWNRDLQMMGKPLLTVDDLLALGVMDAESLELEILG